MLTRSEIKIMENFMHMAIFITRMEKFSHLYLFNVNKLEVVTTCFISLGCLRDVLKRITNEIASQSNEN